MSVAAAPFDEVSTAEDYTSGLSIESPLPYDMKENSSRTVSALDDDELIPVGEMIQTTHLIGQEAMQLASHALTHNWSHFMDQKEPTRLDSGVIQSRTDNYTQTDELLASTPESEEEDLEISHINERQINLSSERNVEHDTTETKSEDYGASQCASHSMEDEILPVSDLFNSTHLIGAEAAELIQNAIRNGLAPIFESSTNLCAIDNNPGENNETTAANSNEKDVTSSNNKSQEEAKESTRTNDPSRGMQLVSNLKAIRFRKQTHDHQIIEEDAVEIVHNSASARRSAKAGQLKRGVAANKKVNNTPGDVGTNPPSATTNETCQKGTTRQRIKNAIQKQTSQSRSLLRKQNEEEERPDATQKVQPSSETAASVARKPRLATSEKKPQPNSSENKQENQSAPKRITRTYVNHALPSIEKQESLDTMTTVASHGSIHMLAPPSDLVADQSQRNDPTTNQPKEGFRILRVLKAQPHSKKSAGSNPRQQSPAKKNHLAGVKKALWTAPKETRQPSEEVSSRAKSVSKRQSLRLSQRTKSLTEKPARMEIL